MTECVCQCISGPPGRNLTIDCQNTGFISIDRIQDAQHLAVCNVNNCDCVSIIQCTYDDPVYINFRTNYWRGQCDGKTSCTGNVNDGYKECTGKPNYYTNHERVYFNCLKPTTTTASGTSQKTTRATSETSIGPTTHYITTQKSTADRTTRLTDASSSSWTPQTKSSSTGIATVITAGNTTAVNTPTPTRTRTPTPAVTPTPTTAPSTGAIIGAVVGGSVVIVLIVLAIIYFRRKKSSTPRKETPMNNLEHDYYNVPDRHPSNINHEPPRGPQPPTTPTDENTYDKLHSYGNVGSVNNNEYSALQRQNSEHGYYNVPDYLQLKND